MRLGTLQRPPLSSVELRSRPEPSRFSPKEGDLRLFPVPRTPVGGLAPRRVPCRPHTVDGSPLHDALWRQALAVLFL